MIVKVIRYDHPFVQIDKRVMEDERLSYKAKGLMGYLLSRPPDWIVRRDDLIARSTDGREAVQSGMAELRDVGYAELIDAQDESGRMMGKRWVVAESPELLQSMLEKLRTDGRENRPTGNPADGKPAATNNDRVVMNDSLSGEPELALSIEIEYADTGEKVAEKVSRVVAEAQAQAMAEAIYAEYPVKSNRKAALREIRKAMKERDPAWLLEITKRYAINRMGENSKYTKNPDNWFRDGNYDDDEKLWRDATRFPQNGNGNFPTQGSKPAAQYMSAADRRKARGQ